MFKKLCLCTGIRKNSLTLKLKLKLYEKKIYNIILVELFKWKLIKINLCLTPVGFVEVYIDNELIVNTQTKIQ